MKTRSTVLAVLCLLTSVLCLATGTAASKATPASPVAAARKDIGATVEEKKETVEVTQVSRIWRIQADADKTITVFFERVAIFPDGKEVLLGHSSATRPVDTAAGPLEQIEKLARTWLAEDQAAEAPPAPPP